VQGSASQKSYGPVFAEFDLGLETAKYMVLDGKYKYTFCVHDIAELYNLREDPEEIHDLAQRHEYRKIVETLKRKLFAWHRPAELD
jgi:choline-sulfatase